MHSRLTSARSGHKATYSVAWALAAGAFLLIFLLTGCEARQEPPYAPTFGKTPPRTGQTYVVGVHPLHNPKRLHEIFGPITDHLTANIPGVTFELEASRSYAAFDEKLYARRFDFALPNPYQTVLSLEHGYHVFGKMGDDENFRGIILTRKDSGIQTVADLKGRAVSFPAPTALAATMMPQLFLQTHGVDVMHELDLRYVGSQESSIMNVYLGDTAAGSTWPPPWNALVKERPELADALQVQWQTEPLPNNGLVVRDDVPDELVAKVGELLFALHTHPQGRAWLQRMELSRFEAANDEAYAPVVHFLRDFDETVRPIER